MTITQALDAIDRHIGGDVLLGYRLGSSTQEPRRLPASAARQVVLTVASAATDQEARLRFTVISTYAAARRAGAAA